MIEPKLYFLTLSFLISELLHGAKKLNVNFQDEDG